MRILPFIFGLFYFTLWPLTSVRISVSHAHACPSFCLMIGLQFKSRAGFPDGLIELKGVMIFCMNALPLLPVTFSSQPFTSLVLHTDPVPLSILRCWCIKACFWFYQIDVQMPMRSTATRVQSSVSCIFLM